VSRRKRSPRSKPAGGVAVKAGDANEASPADEASSGRPLSDSDAARFRRRLLIAVALVAVWWAVLIALVVFTANPVTLNRRQLGRSEKIVTAQILDAADGQVKVVKDWSGAGLTGEIRVDGLADVGARDGKTYIIPLSLTRRGGWEITPVPDSSHRQQIYPATDDALKQLAEFAGNAKGTGR